MLQWHPKLVALVAILILIAVVAAFGGFSFGGSESSGFSW
jgi:hypothetical protein